MQVDRQTVDRQTVKGWPIARPGNLSHPRGLTGAATTTSTANQGGEREKEGNMVQTSKTSTH